MGNTPERERPNTERQWGISESYQREVVPPRRDLSPAPGYGQRSEPPKEYARSKSVKDISVLNRSGLLDSSISYRGRLARPHQIVSEDVAKATQFCTRFIVSCQEQNMNSNINQASAVFGLSPLNRELR